MQRRNRLMKEQAKISKQLNKAKIGNTYKVLFEGLSQESDLLFQGRFEGQTQDIDGYIFINDMPENLKPQIGALYDVRITEAHEYDDFNLIVAHRGISASLNSRERTTTRLAPGIYGLSNHLLDTPWPKVLRAKAAFAALLGSSRLDTGQFFPLLADKTPAPDGDLPHTGVSMEWERTLSPVFIAAPGYGTRASTVLLAHRNGSIRFHERSFGEGGKMLGDVEQQILAY